MLATIIRSCLQLTLPEISYALTPLIFLVRYHGRNIGTIISRARLGKIGTKTALGLACVVGLSSCASVSVDKSSEYATKGKPQKIYVALFATGPGKFKVDREGAELVTFKQDLQIMLQKGMVTDLNKRLLPAIPLGNEPVPVAENAWLIKGEFVTVNQGSRLLRGAIGFGAGGTKMETKVDVYDLKRSGQPPFLTFATTGGSGAEPGAVTALATDPVEIAVQAAAGSAGGVSHGVTEDAARTAREITAELSDYMYRSGWISHDQWIQPKKLDQ